MSIDHRREYGAAGYDAAPGAAAAGYDAAAADVVGGPGPGGDGAGAEPVNGFAQLRSRGRYRGVLCFVGPAFVAAVAYIDPGNFATNVTAGARFGYTLIWVVVVANLMAMLVQYQSAKLGVATGRDLAQVCRDSYGPVVTTGLWLQAEMVAMATDVAEFVGAAIGLNLIFGAPLPVAGVLTAIVAFVILWLEQRGFRRFELVIAGFLALVFLGFAFDLVTVGADVGRSVAGLVPHLPADSVVLAAGIVGATVMPHVVYLHSALTKDRVSCRDESERRQLLRFQRLDVMIALGAAGLVNVAMIMVAASVFGGHDRRGVDTLEAAHAGLARLAGGGAALAFAVALLASGLSSSSVGTYAGQVVMQGFLRRQVPLLVRRAITMGPAITVLLLGFSPTSTLVVSQVLLSFAIPFALVPLTMLSRRRDIMGPLVNSGLTTATMASVSGAIVALSGYLVYTTVLS